MSQRQTKSPWQEYLKDRLKGLEALVQGGCKAFAEGDRSSAQPTEARP